MREIRLDTKRCLACRSCEMACAVAHSASQHLRTALAQEPPPMPRLKVKQTQSARATVSLCRLCRKPPCIPACARGAISQSVVTRLTVVDSNKCAECETLACVAACPFGAIHAHRERRILLVCDRCLHLDSPACVRACPTGVFKLS